MRPLLPVVLLGSMLFAVAVKPAIPTVASATRNFERLVNMAFIISPKQRSDSERWRALFDGCRMNKATTPALLPVCLAVCSFAQSLPRFGRSAPLSQGCRTQGDYVYRDSARRTRLERDMVLQVPDGSAEPLRVRIVDPVAGVQYNHGYSKLHRLAFQTHTAGRYPSTVHRIARDICSAERGKAGRGIIRTDPGRSDAADPNGNSSGLGSADRYDGRILAVAVPPYDVLQKSVSPSSTSTDACLRMMPSTSGNHSEESNGPPGPYVVRGTPGYNKLDDGGPETVVRRP
jgi:hypothetical protein